jgi:succinoglycan biosynthesis protein ExoM
MNEKKILISVCIATYKREKLLERLLQSLTEQVLEQNIKIEIIVTDNNIEESAKSILSKFISTDKILFKYFIQPIKNISLTRNVCVENATGDYICFIDDDETADKNWIGNLLDCFQKFNADGAFGYVEPVFDKGVPSHFKNRSFYFSPMGKTGSLAKFFFTTNAIVKSELIKNEDGPFNSAYGLTGGEDVHLFERLERKGAFFVNCREAVTFEFIPIERTNNKYLYKRALRGGQAFARRKLERKNNFIEKFKILSKASLMIFFSLTFYCLRFYSKFYKIEYIQILGASVGKIRSLFKFYKIIH